MFVTSMNKRQQSNLHRTQQGFILNDLYTVQNSEVCKWFPTHIIIIVGLFKHPI